MAASWRDALARTRRRVADALSTLFSSSTPQAPVATEELEAVLIGADVPVRLVDGFIREVTAQGRPGTSSSQSVLRNLLLAELPERAPFDWRAGASPLVILVVGVNGSGKTTTCAKLAHLAMNEGRRPVLGATDTFRAAGSEQLKHWADRLRCDVVTGAQRADAAAVAYDTLDAALARGADTVILDTAGRMHTRQPLLEELKKIMRAMQKRLQRDPDEVWLVLDATMGQNAIIQARVFHEAVPLTGTVIAKLDGSSKGGFVFAIADELELPVRFVGLGEGDNDLAPFDPEAFVDALLGLQHTPDQVRG